MPSERTKQRQKDRRRGLKDGLALCYISSGMVHHRFMDSVCSTYLHDARSGDNRILSPKGGYLSLISSPRIISARTQAVEKFLTAETFQHTRWLVTVDTDMAWKGNAIHRMIDHAEEHEWPIVGGLCVAGAPNEHQYLTMYATEGLLPNGLPNPKPIDFTTPERVEMITSGAAFRVDATGAAFMAIRRDVMLNMHEAFSKTTDGQLNPYPWYGELIGDGVEFGEDITFCLRARQLGYEVWIDSSVLVDHIKHSAMNLDTFVAYAQSQQKAKAPLTLP